MPGIDPTRRQRTPWTLFVAILCVLLVVVAGAVQVVHMHTDGTDTHADCSLCAAAHVSLQSVAQQLFTPPVQMVRVVELNRQSRPPSLNLPFALFNRPPPAA